MHAASLLIPEIQMEIPLYPFSITETKNVWKFPFNDYDPYRMIAHSMRNWKTFLIAKSELETTALREIIMKNLIFRLDLWFTDKNNNNMKFENETTTFFLISFHLLADYIFI